MDNNVNNFIRDYIGSEYNGDKNAVAKTDSAGERFTYVTLRMLYEQKLADDVAGEAALRGGDGFDLAGYVETALETMGMETADELLEEYGGKDELTEHLRQEVVEYGFIKPVKKKGLVISGCQTAKNIYEYRNAKAMETIIPLLREMKFVFNADRKKYAKLLAALSDFMLEVNDADLVNRIVDGE